MYQIIRVREQNKLITIAMSSQQAQTQSTPIIHHHYHYMVAPQNDRFQDLIGNASKYAVNESFARGEASHSHHSKILSDSICTSSKRSWKDSLNPEINRRYEQINGKIDILKDAQSTLSFCKKHHSAKQPQVITTRNQPTTRGKASSRKQVSVSDWQIKPLNPSHTSLGESLTVQTRQKGRKSMLIMPSSPKSYEESYETRLLKEQCKYLRAYCLQHYEDKHPEFTKHRPHRT